MRFKDDDAIKVSEFGDMRTGERDKCVYVFAVDRRILVTVIQIQNVNHHNT